MKNRLSPQLRRLKCHAHRTEEAHNESGVRGYKAPVEAEIHRASSPQVAELMRKLLVPLRCDLRPWAHGAQGTLHTCLILAEHQRFQTAIAYCEYGFGPRTPWGLLWTVGDHLSMGDDSGWFTSFEDAVMDSFAANDLDLLRGTIELPPTIVNGRTFEPQMLHFERRIYAGVMTVNCNLPSPKRPVANVSKGSLWKDCHSDPKRGS